MSAAAGLLLVADDRRTADATTFGVGELIRDAVSRGANPVLVGLGGSATTDGGCGAAAANATLFTDQNEAPFVPVGRTLSEIAHIDTQDLTSFLADTKIIALCDIASPLLGPTGPAQLFGTQKGADATEITQLETGLTHLAELITNDLGKSVADLAGAGAAGGMGAGLAAFFDAELRPGVNTILDAVNFDNWCAEADLVFTGEGRLDSQSLQGKATIGVANRAAKLQVPVWCFVGQAEPQASQTAKTLGITEIVAINPPKRTFVLSMKRVEANLYEATRKTLKELLDG